MDNHKSLDSECSTEVQNNGHENNSKLMGVWWLLAIVKKQWRKEYLQDKSMRLVFQNTNKKLSASMEVRDRI